MQTSRQMLYAAVGGGAIFLGFLALSNRKRLQTWIRTVWNGDADLDHAAAVFGVVADNLRLLRQQLASSSDAVAAAREGRLGTAAAAATRTSSADSTGGDGVPAALTGKNANGYYYFASTGEKVKNKWDSFDVDAELEKVDKPSGGAGTSTKPAAAAQRVVSAADGRAALKKVQAVILDGERCLLDIDAALTVQPGSEAEERRSSSAWAAARARKRALLADAHALLKDADTARSALDAALAAAK